MFGGTRATGEHISLKHRVLTFVVVFYLGPRPPTEKCVHVFGEEVRDAPDYYGDLSARILGAGGGGILLYS